jgi:hypothetical protein
MRMIACRVSRNEVPPGWTSTGAGMTLLSAGVSLGVAVVAAAGATTGIARDASMSSRRISFVCTATDGTYVRVDM